MAIDPSFGNWDEATMDQKIERVTAPTFDRYLYLASDNWGARNLNNRDYHLRYYCPPTANRTIHKADR